MKCEEVSRYLSPYLDSALDPKTNFEMSGHFEQCTTCRDRFEAERRIELSISAELLRPEPGDEDLWGRAKNRLIRPKGRGGLWALLLLSIVAIAILGVVFAPRPGAGLARELRAAYTTFIAGRSQLEVVDSDSKTVETFCSDKLGLPLRVPGKVGALELEGARKCSLRGASTAFLSYRRADSHIVVFVFNADHLDRFSEGDRVRGPSVDDTEDPRVVISRSAWKVIAVVGSTSPDELDEVRRAFQDP